jgi:hypothetical protein
MMSPYVTAPDHVAACDLGPVTVLVDYRTGAVRTLMGPSAQWWAELAATGDPDSPTALDDSSAQALLGQLRAAGLLVSADQARPWPAPVAGSALLPSWGTHEIQVGRAPIPAVPPRLQAVASLALAVVLVARHAGPSRASMSRLIRLLARTVRRTVRPASAEHARLAVYAVRRAGLLAPGRVACLEESAAVVLTLAASRERVEWCHGVAADPIRLHAWVQADGQPVAEPPSTLRYTALRTI